MGRPVIDLTGQKFGTLTAVKVYGRTKTLQATWLCQCDCGREVVVRSSSLRHGGRTHCGSIANHGRSKEYTDAIAKGLHYCYDCETAKPAEEFSIKKRSWTGRSRRCRECTLKYQWIGNCNGTERDAIGFAKYALNQCRHKCRRNGTRFDLTLEFLVDKLTNGCEVTGLPFNFKDKRCPFGPSLDRIKPQGDYTMDNVRVVCLAYNLGRSNWSDRDMLTIARALVSKSRARSNNQRTPARSQLTLKY